MWINMVGEYFLLTHSTKQKHISFGVYFYKHKQYTHANPLCILCGDMWHAEPDDPEQITNQTRKLGLVVIRGTQVSLVSPEEGTEEIANPFLGGGEEEEEEE